MDHREFALFIIKRLCKRFYIDIHSFHIYFDENVRLPPFIYDQNKRGFCSTIKSSNQYALCFCPSRIKDDETWIRTCLHEFRHLLQRLNRKNHDINHWIGWAEQHLGKIGYDAYLFSPTEMDAVRFARSNGKYYDWTIFTRVHAHEKAYLELQRNRDVAAWLALHEGFHLLREDTLQRLIFLDKISNQAYLRWLSSDSFRDHQTADRDFFEAIRSSFLLHQAVQFPKPPSV